MKVKATTNLGSNDYPLHPLTDGEEAEVPKEIGCRMVANGHAVAIAEPEPVAVKQPEPEEKTPEPAESSPPAKAATPADKPKFTKK